MVHPFLNRPSFESVHDGLFGFGTGHQLRKGADATLSGFARSVELADDGGDLWANYAAMQLSVFKALRATSIHARKDLYANLFGSALTHGFAQGNIVRAGLNSESSRLHVGKIVLDRFFRLAEAVGATNVKSAEHGQLTIDCDNLESIFSSIENIIDADLTPPDQAGDLFGLKLHRGIFSDRHFDGIYGAWRAREWLKATGQSPDNIVEIGGGAGHLAFYARRMGFKKVTIIDLPQALCAQFMVLAGAYPDGSVKLNDHLEEGIELLSSNYEFDQSFNDAQIVVNIDSFPEMPQASAVHYLEQVPNGVPLLSINQESSVANGSGGSREGP